MASDLKHWAGKFKAATDSDATIGAMARYYTCSIMYDMGAAISTASGRRVSART